MERSQGCNNLAEIRAMISPAGSGMLGDLQRAVDSADEPAEVAGQHRESHRDQLDNETDTG
jgi:hypothetical protein